VAIGQQAGKVRRLAVFTVNAKSDPQIQAQFAAFVKRLQELGWKDGSNIRIEYRFGEGDVTRMFQLAKELLEFRPDVIFAATNPAATAIRQQTLSIPIVFAQVPDPVAAGFVTNLARPEGNITGFVNFEFSIGEKWLQTLTECAPKVRRVAVLFDPGNPTWAAYLRPIEASASKFGVQLTPVGTRNPADLKQAIDAFAKSPNGALVVFPAPVTTTHRETIISLAAQHRLPAIYPFEYFTANGGLMSYGVDLSELYRQAASYVDRILKGAKPADLPVQLPTKMELVINLKTAKAIGITVPQSLLQRADRVIE
jgi:putative ABC transport system substrate-binding protein